jgi:hypothetical protein
VTLLDIYLDASTTATSAVVGLYSNNASNNPGTLLTQATISPPVRGAWNVVAVPSASVTAGSKYWIAVLSPAGSGLVKFRDVASSGRSQVNSQTGLTILPATWSAGATFANAPMSAYAQS